MSEYKFISKQEIAELRDKKYASFYDAFFELIDRIIAERDAIRKVGLAYFKWRFDRDPELQNRWDGKTTTEEDFDAEVASLLG